MSYIPLILTASRCLGGLFIVPVCVLGLMPSSLVGSIFTSLVFALLALTDYFDGLLARKLNSQSAIGRVFDPLADKMLVFGMLISFVSLDVWFCWPVFFLFLRDLLVLGARTLAAESGTIVTVLQSAKYKTTLQLIVLSLLPIGYWFDGIIYILLYILVWFTVLLSYISCYDYCKRARLLHSN